MKNRALYYIAIIFLSLLFFCTSYGVTIAALPNPRPTPIPCNITRDDEFHSLRPYQASPCNQNYEDLALFCGNDFMMQDTVAVEKVYYDIPWGEAGAGLFGPSPEDPSGWEFSWDLLFEGEQCVSNPDVRQCGGGDICEAVNCEPGEVEGMETCEFTIDREVPISINLDGAELPIMGYTEPSEETSDPYEVRNLVNPISEEDETLTHPDKVNEYVSWYLNGVIGRKEYGDFNQSTQQGRSMNIDYSGPLKRLLPFENQIIIRNEEVVDAMDSFRCNPPNDPNCIRHDQIIACYNIITGQPTECSNNPFVRTRRLSNWEDGMPPLPSAFDTLREYFDALLEWRRLHLTTRDTYKFIPFSSTEDRLGMVNLGSYWVQPISPEDTCIICAYITNQIPATLFFSHMQESFELADLLQQIHSPQGADLNAGPLNVQKNDYALCNIAEVRKNPGDNLFSTGLSATVEYTADIICEDSFLVHGDGNLCRALGGECIEENTPNLNCTTYYNQVDCPDEYFCGVGCNHSCTGFSGICATCDPLNPENPCIPYGPRCCDGLVCDGDILDPSGTRIGKDCVYGDPVTRSSWNSYNAGTCEKDLMVAFQTQTHTPLATETWAKLVSGPYGAFRRIFPQIEDEEGRPIRRLWDIPTETNVQFNVDPPFSIVGGSQHQIYFPHIGGIHEYFLNCLQKTLRPVGYGQGCVSAPELSSSTPGTGQTYWCPTPPPTEPIPGAGCCTITKEPRDPFAPEGGGIVDFCMSGLIASTNNRGACTIQDFQIRSACDGGVQLGGIWSCLSHSFCSWQVDPSPSGAYCIVTAWSDHCEGGNSCCCVVP